MEMKEELEEIIRKTSIVYALDKVPLVGEASLYRAILYVKSPYSKEQLRMYDDNVMTQMRKDYKGMIKYD